MGFRVPSGVRAPLRSALEARDIVNRTADGSPPTPPFGVPVLHELDRQFDNAEPAREGKLPREPAIWVVRSWLIGTELMTIGLSARILRRQD
jgi:hypothetical protein